MKIIQNNLPHQWQGVLRMDYVSSIDGFMDWALVHPSSQDNDTWIVMIHGHGSHGDQLYTRADIKDNWLPIFLQHNFGILSPNLRDNAWMGPKAADDLHDLIAFVRAKYNAKHLIFASGSMGGTSNLIYASLHPEDVSAVVALGAASDLTRYFEWCRTINNGVIKEIADAIESAYSGSPKKRPEIYKKHSALENSAKLTMPIYLSHGGNDQTIPVDESRRLADKLSFNAAFFYHEIPGGNHDSPLWLMAEGIKRIIEKL